MSQNTKQTGKDAASKAGKLLSNPKSSPNEKEVAGSDLSQRPPREK